MINVALDCSSEEVGRESCAHELNHIQMFTHTRTASNFSMDVCILRTGSAGMKQLFVQLFGGVLGTGF